MAETRWTFIEDLPRLEKGTLRRANAFAPGTKTLWQWGAGARASLTEAIAVPGGLLLKDFAGETTVLSRPWYLVCPSCHRENRYLLLDRARRRWCCRRCSGADYRIRHQPRLAAILRQQAILRRLIEMPEGRGPKVEALQARLRSANAQVRALTEWKNGRRNSTRSD
jgi:hypothetical protein